MKRFFVIILCMSFLFIPARAAAPQKLVALTFDDGPSGRFTRALLDGLDQRSVKATFLLCGYRIKQYPKLTQQIHNAGHEIGLHGYSHKAMDQMCLGDLLREIDDTLKLLPQGCNVQFLRPPGGQCNGVTQNAAKRRQLSLLCWSVDPRDWACHDAAAIQHQVLCQVRSGDVILLHDMSDSSVEAALAIVDKLLAQGFQFVTVSELAEATGTNLQPGVIYCRFDG